MKKNERNGAKMLLFFFSHILAFRNSTFKRISLVMLLIGLMGFSVQGQELQVRGTVTDSEGEGIPGVTVMLDGTSQGTITNNQGNYSLENVPREGTLVFSFIGMRTERVNVDGRQIIDMVMEEQALGLDEVVVVGYGQQKKESVVASISTISSEDIVRSPSSNLTSGLSGKMPGLNIRIMDGELGRENIQTLIRGQATMNNAQPLILVDGVERELSTINPYDVESISVLKDASATAVYGVRGANGVILVTTKKGIESKPSISANLNYSLQKPTRTPNPMNAIDYMKTRNSVIDLHNETTGQSTPLPFPQEVFDRYENDVMPEYYVDRDFYEEFLYDFVPMMKGNVNLRGGTDVAKYYASVGYMRQGGPFKTERWAEYDYDNEQRLDRLTYRANVDLQVTKNLKAWLNLSGHLQDKNDPMLWGDNPAAAGNTSYYYLQMAHLADIPAISFPDVNEEGDVISTPGMNRTPYGGLNRTGYKINTNNKINSTIGLEQDLDFITKGLSVRGVVAYDSEVTHIRGFQRSYQTFNQVLDESDGDLNLTYIPGAGTDGQLSGYLTQFVQTNLDLEASFNYNRSIGDNHHVTGLLLYKQNKRVIEAQIPYNYIGVVGRATYDYKKKYLAEFNFGMNGSEQFAPGNRFGFFPSLSVGWVLSEEAFLDSSEGIDFLKLRASFGQVGNDRMGSSRFVYLGDWTQNYGGYFQSLGGMPGLPAPVYERSIPNRSVTWEVANKYNFGIESQFLNGFEFDLDLFYEKRSSILINNSPIPRYMFGQLSLPPLNDGEMTNKGFEAILGYKKKVNSDLFLAAQFSAAFARNKVEDINEIPFPDDYAYPLKQEGFSRGTLWGYDCLGYFESEEEINAWADQSGLGAKVLPGDLKYRDANGDGVIDSKDMIPMDYPSVPELNYSLTLSGEYKGFDFNVLFHAVDNYTFNTAESGRGVYDWYGDAYGGFKNYFEHHHDAWTPEKAANGGSINYPRMHPDGITVSKQPSNYWMVDLWYMRLRNIEFGYSLPQNVISNIGLENLRVFLSGQNVLTIDNMLYDALDPEISNSLSHPIFATYNLGVNITF